MFAIRGELFSDLCVRVQRVLNQPRLTFLADAKHFSELSLVAQSSRSLLNVFELLGVEARSLKSYVRSLSFEMATLQVRYSFL